jgi:cytochrome c oxidase assembly protein subunit 15
MGDRLIPPTNELLDRSYARTADHSDLLRRNVFENPTTVQFDHRLLAVTTFSSAVALFFYVRRRSIKAVLPRAAVRGASEILTMALLQASLGISTLVYLVPTTLASLHQAGSLVLLSLAIAAGASLRRPSRAARVWMAHRGILQPR